MSFRDEVEAARARRDVLRAGSSDDPEIAAELAVVEAHIDGARARAALKVLQDVRIATPCPASWAAMVGGDSVRHCALCEKNVYDLAGLTAVEAVHLLVAKEGNACVRLHRRRDGTLITADCEVGRRRRRRRWLKGAAASLVIGGATALAQPGGSVSRGATPISEGDDLRIDEAAFFEPPGPRELTAAERAEIQSSTGRLVRMPLPGSDLAQLLSDAAQVSSEEDTFLQDTDDEDRTIPAR